MEVFVNWYFFIKYTKEQNTSSNTHYDSLSCTSSHTCAAHHKVKIPQRTEVTKDL